jgi:hypothetical protein
MDPTKTTKEALVAVCNALITGITGLANADTIVSAGQSFTKAQLLAPLTAYVVLPNDTASAKAVYTKAVATEAAGKAAALEMIQGIIQPYLQLRLGKDSPDLETYGLQPAKVATKPVATKAAAVAKGQATRKALGTKGKNQKKAAKAQIAATPVSPTPVTPAKS